MFSIEQRKPARVGITLVELLVVISILTLLTAFAIPRIRPMMENRNIREAARAINVFFAQARIRASETQRPHGVYIERATDLNQRNVCITMRQVELPPPYAGDTTDAKVRLQRVGAAIPLKARVKLGDFSSGLVRRGDKIQLNHQGPLYTIVDDSSNTNDIDCDADGYLMLNSVDYPNVGDTYPNDANADTWSDEWLSLRADSTQPSPWPLSPNWSEVPCKIFRQPALDTTTGFKGFGSIAPSLQLPRGAVIDLKYSGIGSGTEFMKKNPTSGTITKDKTSVVVMFSPNGAVDRVCHSYLDVSGVLQYKEVPVSSPIFFLVGRWDRAINVAEDGLTNWEDMSNFWIAINPQTGLVTVAEPASRANANASRALARQAQISKGGR